MFGISKCYWATHSETDNRFNLNGECWSVFDTTPMEKAVKEVEEKYEVERPKDLYYSVFKD